MFVNNWPTTLVLLVTVLNFQFQHSHEFNVGGGTIREEDLSPVQVKRASTLAAGKSNDDKESSSHSSSSSSSGSLTNKEFVFGEEDDEDSKAVPSNSNNNKPAVSQAVSEFGGSDLNNNNMIDSDPSKLARAQRTDHKHAKHEEYSTFLEKFHRMKDLQRKLAEEQEDRYNFDYDEAIEREFLKNALFEDDMKAKEMRGPLIPSYLIKAAVYNAEDMAKYNNGGFNNKNDFDERQPKKEHNKNKPVKVIDFNENLYMEKDYNNKLLGSTPKNQFFSSGSAVFNGIVSEQSMGDNQAGLAINSQQPSLKQKNNFVDSSLNAKFDFIKQQNDYLFIFVVAGCTLAGVVALMAAGVCWYTVHKNSKTNSDGTDFKSGLFGTPGSGGSIKSKTSTNSGDRRLAQSAQMYHYQHQKQQMIAMEKANNDTKPDNSDNSEGETEEGDYTVYECPGLAPTGEMEVKNPLFKEDFSASSNNILASSISINSMPPAYSTVTSSAAAAPTALVSEATVAQQTSAPVADQETPKQAAVGVETATINMSEEHQPTQQNQENNSVLIPINESVESTNKQ